MNQPQLRPGLWRKASEEGTTECMSLAQGRPETEAKPVWQDYPQMFRIAHALSVLRMPQGETTRSDSAAYLRPSHCFPSPSYRFQCSRHFYGG